MPLVLANRVQETASPNTTVSFTLAGAVLGFQAFSVIGNGNTTYYSATDASGNWEVGVGTYSTTGPTLTRDTVYASSNSGSPVTFSGTVNVFVTYPSGKSVNLDGSGNVSALGTVSSGTWQGSTVGVAYGGTGVTTSSGANSVMLRDANQNVAINRLNQANTSTTASGGTTALTAASSYSHTLVGTGNQTFTLPDATTLTTGVAFLFNNMATGTITIQDYASATVGTITAGGAGAVFLINNSTVGGTWDIHGYLPEGVTWGTNALNLGTTVISNGTWQGGTIQPAYGGTGLTTFTGANNALYSTGATTLTAGTLPVVAGGTGVTTTPANGQLLIGNGTNYTVALLGTGTGISTTTGSGTLTINNTGVTSLAGSSPVTASASTGSVTMSLASGYGDTQNPYASKTANFFLAAPNGTAGAPTFRAIVAADIPTLNQNTTGSAGSVVNAVTFNNGGAGDVSGTTFNGSAARTISYNTVGAPSTGGANATGTWGISISGNAATATTASNVNNGTLSMGVSGTGLSGSASFTANQSGNSTFTVTSNATSANTASTIVARDGSGNFSAGTITATLSGSATSAGSVSNSVTFNNGGAGGASGSTFNGSGALTVSYNTVGAPSTTGANATGTWGINISGNAATASNASLLNSISAVNLYNNMGDAHSTRTSFDATTPSYGFGYRYVQGSTNGPGTGGTQYYSWYIGLGSDYPATGAGSYGAMFAVDRNVTTPYLSVRYNEGNSFSAWRKVAAGYADSAGSATTATTATNWGSYGAVPAAGTSFGNANTIGRSDGNGYTYFNYINSNTGNSENPGVSQVIVTNGSDNFYRKASIAHLTSSLSGTAPINITGSAGSATTATNVSGGTVSSARINPRTSTTTSAASIDPNIASFDQYAVTAQAVALAINAPTGTPVDGNKLMFRILDNGSPRAITWNGTYTPLGVTLPTTTTANKMTYVGCVYNAANTRWDVIAVTTQA